MGVPRVKEGNVGADPRVRPNVRFLTRRISADSVGFTVVKRGDRIEEIVSAGGARIGLCAVFALLVTDAADATFAALIDGPQIGSTLFEVTRAIARRCVLLVRARAVTRTA